MTSTLKRTKICPPWRRSLNSRAYLGFRAAGLAVPPGVLEIGKNVVGTSEITGEKWPNIAKF